MKQCLIIMYNVECAKQMVNYVPIKIIRVKKCEKILSLAQEMERTVPLKSLFVPYRYLDWLGRYKESKSHCISRNTVRIL